MSGRTGYRYKDDGARQWNVLEFTGVSPRNLFVSKGEGSKFLELKPCISQSHLSIAYTVEGQDGTKQVHLQDLARGQSSD